MSDLVKYLVENDPLKSASELIDSADFHGKKQNHDKNLNISISFLFLISALIALTKTIYGDSGFNIGQHFVTSLFIVFVGYVSFGVILLLLGRPYSTVSNWIRCFLTCFIAALVVSLFLVYFSDEITRIGVTVVGLFVADRLSVGTLADAAPAALFSLIGCFAIFRLKGAKMHPKNRAAYWMFLPVYWILTATAFYFVAYDRGWLFQNVMKYTTKIVAS